MTFDPELPAGFQDADFEMRELEEYARRDARMRKAGQCPHSHRQGREGANNPALAGTPSKPRADRIVPEGYDLCLECGKSVAAWLFR